MENLYFLVGIGDTLQMVHVDVQMLVPCGTSTGEIASTPCLYLPTRSWNIIDARQERARLALFSTSIVCLHHAEPGLDLLHLGESFAHLYRCCQVGICQYTNPACIQERIQEG